MTTQTHGRTAPGGERARNQLTARLLAAVLDRRLAAGASPGSSVLLAARARQLSSPAQRQRLTRGWLVALDQATRPPWPLSPRVRPLRGPIVAAQGDIRLMLAVVQGTPVLGARGMALARMLLSDGAGPLYNPRCSEDLVAAVQDATRLMRAR
jgi:hypothetical protein